MMILNRKENDEGAEKAEVRNGKNKFISIP